MELLIFHIARFHITLPFLADKCAQQIALHTGKRRIRFGCGIGWCRIGIAGTGACGDVVAIAVAGVGRGGAAIAAISRRSADIAATRARVGIAGTGAGGGVVAAAVAGVGRVSRAIAATTR